MSKILANLRKSFLQYIVIGVYFGVLLTECYFLYIRDYGHRLFTRPELLPILFLVFLMQFISRNHLLLLGAMITACAADFLTIRYVIFHQWLGLASYTISYIMMSIIFFKIQWFTFKDSKLALMIGVGGLLLYILSIEFFSYSHNIFLTRKPYMYLYASSIAILVISVLNVYFNNKNIKLTLALVAISCLVVGNLLFEVSIFVLHRKYTWVDGICAFLYGVYLYTMVRCVIKIKDKIDGVDYFNRI